MGQYHARLTVEPCHDPPAVGVVIRDALGETLVDETLVSSRTQPIRWNGVYLFDLIINISHMRDPDSIVLKVSLGPPDSPMIGEAENTARQTCMWTAQF